jgi:hypothetical protein
LKNPVLSLSCVVLTVALTFGGATRQGLASDAIPEVVSLPLLGLAVPRAVPFLRRSPSAAALIVGAVALPCAQLIPLPPWLWGAMPGREAIVDLLASADAPLSWRPISLIPAATERALLSLIPAVAVFLGALSLDREARRLLLLLAVAIGVVSAPIAMLQVLDGRDSAFYFFEFTNVGKGVGFFANANHFGAFEYALLPLAAAALMEMRTRSLAFLLAVLGGVLPALLFGLALSGSRSAIVLGAASIVAAVPLLLGHDLAKLGRYRTLALTAGLALTLVPLMLGLGMLEILTRLATQDIAEDARWAIAASTWEGIWSYLPFGAGIGTFPSVYPFHERIVDLIPQFVNRAHDDGLETLLEGGIASLVLLIGFVVWLSLATRRALIGEFAMGEYGLADRQAGAGVIVMWLLLLHSLWDYPLRTIALGTVFALCAALQFAPPPTVEGERGLWWPARWWPGKRRRRRRRRRSRSHAKPVRDLAPVN